MTMKSEEVKIFRGVEGRKKCFFSGLDRRFIFTSSLGPIRSGFRASDRAKNLEGTYCL